jgi:hypothetical protein
VMPSRLSGKTLSITPVQAMLDDPATKYPVYIDPGVQAARSAWTMIDSGNPATSYWNNTGDAKVGTNNGGTNKYRSFFNMNVSGLPFVGAHIVSSNLWITETKSASCTPQQVDLWSTSGATSATTWNKAPTFSTLQSSQTVAKGFSSACAAGSVVFSATQVTQAAANSNWSNVTLALRSPNETDNSYYKQFNNNPFLSVTYTQYPSASVSMPAVSTCSAGTTRSVIKTTTPLLRAHVYDQEGATVRPEIEWSDLDTGAKLGSAQPTPGKASDSDFDVTVPAGVLVDGGKYSFRARGYDSTTWGPWGNKCEFAVDTTAPAAPTVSSTTYSPEVWAGGAKQPGTFAFGPAGASDVRRYKYRIDGGTEYFVDVAANQSGSSTTVTIAPPSDGEATLYVTAHDWAGNASAATAYPFLVGRAPSANLPTVADRGAMTEDLPGTPNAACVTGAGRPTVNSLTPQMWATFTDPTATTMSAEFQYATIAGNPLGAESVINVPIAERVVAWVPQNKLETDVAYKWRVRARNADGTEAGRYSSWCEFNVRAAISREVADPPADVFTPDSNSVPDVSTPPEVPGQDEPVPGLEDEPPYTPTPDTGETAAETDADETDLPEGAFSVQELPAAPPVENAVLQTGDSGAGQAECPFDANALPTDGSPGPATNLPDGQFSCSAPQTPEEQTPAQEAGSFSGSEVDAEAGPDTPEAFAVEAAKKGPMAASSLLSATAVGDNKGTALPEECREAPTNKWQVGRYDACISEKRHWQFVTIRNGLPTWDGQINYSLFRYARQSSKRGSWDYHVYIRVDAALGLVSSARVYFRDAWCSSYKCKPNWNRTNGRADRYGDWVQFTAAFTPRVTSGNRVTHQGNIEYTFKRTKDVLLGSQVASSNWVRCDKDLKGSAVVGCVVPNFIPSLRYSRKGKYPDLANHIYDAQLSGLPGKPGGSLVGSIGSSNGLTRLYPKALINKNGNKACPSGLRQRVGAPSSTSCDEYPFRSTYQGAYVSSPNTNLPRSFSWCRTKDKTHNGPVGYSRCFINAKQNSQGGNWVGRWYGTGDGGQRLIEGDRFYVRIS